MGFKKFEEIIVWQRSQSLAVQLYNHFGNLKDYGFRDQITRAAISVSNNIAEGFERNSKAEFKRFLNISLGSIGEVRSMMYLAPKLEYIPSDIAQSLISESHEISKMITSLKNKL